MFNTECHPYYATIIHKRKYPKKHAFSYNSLLISVEINQLDKIQGNIFFGLNKKAIVSIHQKDYGDGKNVKNWVRK